MQKEQDLELISKRACLLHPNQISELIMDSNSDEFQSDLFATEDKECCEEVLMEPHLQSQSEYTACSSAQAPLSPDSAITSEEEDDVQGGLHLQAQQPPN